MGKPGRDRAPSPVDPGDSATRQEVCHEGPPTTSRWGGNHLAQPGSPPGSKNVSYPKCQTSNLKPQQWRSPRPNAKHAPCLRWTRNTRYQGRCESEAETGTPPQEDADADSDPEMIPGPSRGSAPTEPTPPAGSVPALCPALKWEHCTAADWCPKEHPRPDPDVRALCAVGHAAAGAALRYRVAHGWILDETTRGSVII